MLKKLIERRNRRAYAERLQALRETVKPGAFVRVLGSAGTEPRRALVLNARAYSHGPREVYLQGHESEFSGWVSVDLIVPDEPVPWRVPKVEARNLDPKAVLSVKNLTEAGKRDASR